MLSKKNSFLKIGQFLFITCLLFLALGNTSFSQSTSWTGSLTTNWSTSGNWTNGVPTASVNAIIGDASFVSSNHPVISSVASCKSLTIGGSVTATLNVNTALTINGDLIINGNGTLVQGAIAISITGNWSNTGTFSTQASGTVTYAGTNQTIGGSVTTSFAKIIVNSGSTVTLNTNIAVTNSLDLSGTLNPGEPVKKITGNMPISVKSTGVLKVTASLSTGNYESSAITLNQGSAVDYSSTTTDQTIAIYTYSTLRISGSGIKSLNANLPALRSSSSAFGNLSIVAGTLDAGNYALSRGTNSTGGVLSVSAGAKLKIGGTKTFPSNYATNLLDPACTVEYAGTDQAVSPQLYGHLILSSSSGIAVKTMPSSTCTIAGNFTSLLGTGTSVTYAAASDISFESSVNIGTGTTFNGGAHYFTVHGDWVNNGVFTGATSTVTMNGSLASVSGTGTHSFYNLIFSGNNITSTASVMTVKGDLLTTGSGTFTHASGGVITLSGTGKNISSKGILLDSLVIAGTLSLTSATTNITASTTQSNDINVTTGTFTINNESFKIMRVIKANLGRITATTGRIELTGTAAQIIPGNVFTSNILNQLLISNSAGVSINGPLKIIGTVWFGNVNNSFITAKGNLTLVSTASTTANIADLTNAGVNTGNKINGIVTVERYATAKRAYRFLTAPVNTAESIRTNWMENTNNTSTSLNNNPNANFGTHITGTGGNSNGFDETVLNGASLFTFSNAGQAWASVPNTSGVLAAGTAYRILVRGSRSTDLNNNVAPSSTTTLRSKGTLLDGTLLMTKTGGGGTAGLPELSSVTNAFSFIGNPYASSVDWTSVEKFDVSSTIYIFDPTVSGTNGRGAYVSYNANEGTNNNGASYIDENIQSGQAFFIVTDGPDPSLTFRETHKTSAFQPVFKTPNTKANVSVQLLLPSQVTGGGAADGCKVFFTDNYAATLGDEDSYKFTNLDENIAILRSGKSLSIEGRKTIIANDTVPLRIWQLTQKNYTLKIVSSNLPANIQPYLEDAFLQSSTLLANSGETRVPFSITTTAASFATDRFKIVFKFAPPIAPKFTEVKAFEKNQKVEVKWSAESEANTDRFEVEKTTDLKRFVVAGMAKLNTNDKAKIVYSVIDNLPESGDNYYRVKTVGKTGEIKYSALVKVHLADKESGIFASAGSGKINAINFLFKNIEKGTYTVTLLNNAGQKVCNSRIVHSGGSAKHSLSLDTYLQSGIYKARVTNGKLVKTISLFID